MRNIELRWRAHNQYEAVLFFGEGSDVVDHRRSDGRARVTVNHLFRGRVRAWRLCRSLVGPPLGLEGTRPSASREVMMSTRLVTVGTFRSMADAQIARGVLDQAGIESIIRADNAGGMYPTLSSADLIVRPEDAEKATEILSSADPKQW